MQQNIGLMLEKRARLDPHLEAVFDVAPNRRYSYREVNARSNRIAHALLADGVQMGDRVGLLMMNSVEFFETFFAIAKIGAIIVPLNWRLVPDELDFIIGDAGVSVLLFGSEFTNAVSDLQARPSLSALRTYIQVGVGTETPRAPFAVDYEVMRQSQPETEPAVDVVACEDDNLYIMYTSGTTGLPKGVVHTHSTAMWGCITLLATADVCYRDRYLIGLPLFHVGALTPMTGNVQRGMSAVIMRAFDPVATWKLIETERITTMLAVPAMLNAMSQVPEREQTDYSSIRSIQSGAAPVPVALIEFYSKMKIEIQQVYGLTETCGPGCLTNPEDAVSKMGSTGQPFFHTEVRVVGDDGVDVAPGEAGEVWISGPNVMKEYWNRPEATAETLVDGWLKTGDIATVDADGCVYIQDRKKDMIISGGENVYPAEVENAILGLAGIIDAAVIGIPSARWGESGLAVVVRGAEAEGVDAEAVLDHCRDKLARYKQPVAVEFVDEIPRNPSGKILKRLLRERFPGPASE